MKTLIYLLLTFLLIFASCSDSGNPVTPPNGNNHDTILFHLDSYEANGSEIKDTMIYLPVLTDTFDIQFRLQAFDYNFGKENLSIQDTANSAHWFYFNTQTNSYTDTLYMFNDITNINNPAFFYISLECYGCAYIRFKDIYIIKH